MAIFEGPDRNRNIIIAVAVVRLRKPRAQLLDGYFAVHHCRERNKSLGPSAGLNAN